MIHYNRLKVGQPLIVSGLLPLVKVDADGERTERPHKLNNGETVTVKSFTIDSVTVVADGGRESTFAHWTGAQKLTPVKPDKEPPKPAGTPLPPGPAGTPPPTTTLPADDGGRGFVRGEP